MASAVIEFLNDAIRTEKTYDETMQYLMDQQNISTTQYDYYINSLAKQVLKQLVDSYEPPTEPLAYIKIIIDVLHTSGYKLPLKVIHILFILILQNFDTYGLTESEEATFLIFRSAMRQYIMNLIIEKLNTIQTFAEVRATLEAAYLMKNKLYDNLTHIIFKYLFSQDTLSHKKRVALSKLLPFYEEKALQSIRSGSKNTLKLDESSTDKLLGRVYYNLGQKLLSIFQQIREEEGVSDFPASLAQFQDTHGPFNKSDLNRIIHAASPLYHEYVSGSRIAAGKTLVSPNGNVNVSNFPRNRANSAFALHAMRHLLPRYGVRQKSARNYAQAGALIASMDPNVATEELLESAPERQAEMINFLYSHAPNNSNSLAASAVTALRQPSLKPVTEQYYLQTSTTVPSLAKFAHEAGYETPGNLGSYERTLSVPRKPALGPKPKAAGRSVRFNNAAKTVKNVEKYKGGTRRRNFRRN